MITGVDVSSYQPDWKPSLGQDFAFVKATEGSTYRNPSMTGQVKRARNASLVVGFYHWLHAGSVQAQAEHFVRTAGPLDGDLLACDWEQAGVSRADKNAFIAAVKKLRPRCKVGLYCSRSWWNSSDKKAGDFLWVAEYGVSRPAISEGWAIHQYTQDPYDHNRAQFATRAAMKAWATGTTPTPRKDPVPAVVIPSYSMSKKVLWAGQYTGRPRYVDERTYHQLKAVEALLGHPIVMYQGSWSDGSLSADTHAGAGAADIDPTGPVTWRQLETACRQVGMAAFFRNWTGNVHVHALSIGNPGLASWAKVQVQAYLDGYDGLGSNARASRDTGTRSYVRVTWETYVRTIPSVGTHQEEPVPTVMPTRKFAPKLALVPGKAAWLPLNAKGDLSFASGPGLVDALAQVTVNDLPDGGTVNLQIVAYDRYRDAAGKWVNKAVGVLGQNDLNANRGRSNGQVAAHRQVGPTKVKGATRVYRVRAFASHPCVVTSLVVDASITKV